MTELEDPKYVSFTDAAELLVRHGLVGSMTPQGLRYIARNRSQRKTGRWPFGDSPDQEPYLRAGQARMMRTTVLLKHFAKHPPMGRGPDQKPRQRKATNEQ